MAVAGSKYVVQEGDTLWSIAQQAYGNGASYGLIAKENRIRDNNLIFTGMTLTLPRPEARKSALQRSSSQSSATAAPAQRSATGTAPDRRQRPMPIPLPPLMPRACSIAKPLLKYTCEHELFRIEHQYPQGRVALIVKGTLEMQLLEAQALQTSYTTIPDKKLKAKYDSALTGMGADFVAEFDPDRGYVVSSSLLISQKAKLGGHTIICQKTGFELKPPKFIYEAEPREVATKFVPKGGGTPVWVKGNITVRVEAAFEPKRRIRLPPLFAPSPVPQRMTSRVPERNPGYPGHTHEPGLISNVITEAAVVLAGAAVVVAGAAIVVIGTAVVVKVLAGFAAVLAFFTGLALAGALSLTVLAGTVAVFAIAVGANKFLIPAEFARQHGPPQY